MIRSLWSTLVLCTLSIWSLGQTNQEIRDILSSAEFAPAQIGFSVMRMNGSEILGEKQHNRFIPASTYKLITTFAALELLGFEYQYETKLGFRGEIIEDGTLDGDIVIIGSGDPSLGSDKTAGSLDIEEITKKFIEQIERAGIRCVEGDIFIDDQIFDRHLVHDSWTWDDLTNYYACGTSGFNMHENYFRLYFKRSSEPGTPTQVVRTDPPIPSLVIENEVLTGPYGSGDNAYLFGSPYSHKRQIRGTIPPGSGEFSIKGAMPDPAAFYKDYLAQKLMENGISVNNHSITRKSKDNPEIRIVYNHLSPPLSELVSTALEESNNMYCDSFLKTISTLESPTGTYRDGVEAILEFLEANDLERTMYTMNDGSGLSMRNRLSAFQMNKFLVLMSNIWGVEKVTDHIPQVGISRGISGLLQGRNYQKQFWLKSGSMSGILGYSGLLKSENGEFLALTILVNGHTASNSRVRNKIEKLFAAIYLQLNE